MATVAFAADVHFRILQLNDVYKIEGLQNGAVGGLARIRTVRKQLEADGTPLLVMHGGDLLFPSVASKYLGAQQMVRTLNWLDGDGARFDDKMFAVLGNHEFDNADAVYTLGRVAQSDFSWVTSNVHYCAETNCTQTFADRLKNMHDVVVLEIAGVKVGIFGVTILTAGGDYYKIDFQDQAARFADVRAAIAKLKASGARLIVGLTHENFFEDDDLAKAFPEIDFIVGGHDHLYGQHVTGRTLIAKGDADAKIIVIWDVTVPERGRPIVKAAPLSLDSSVNDVPKDPAVDQQVQLWMAKLAKILGPNDAIGATVNMLEGVEPAIRGRETALGNFLADVARSWMSTDVAFINGGSVRINDNIPPGPVRKYDMEGVFYYQNTLVTFNATGQQLLDFLNNSVSRVEVGDGRFLQVAGIRFKYSTQTNPRVAAKDVSIQRKGSAEWTPLDLAATYSTATLQYLYDSGIGDGYVLLDKKNPARPPLLAPIDAVANDYRTATQATINNLPNKTITTAIEGRITGQ